MDMTGYIRYKYTAFGVLGLLFIVIQILAQVNLRYPASSPAKNAVTAAGAGSSLEELAARHAMSIDNPAKEVVLPVCRSRYINLSRDANYPIPHWIYALPKDADKALLLAIARNESRFRPYARSHKGAIGLMQLMPTTAEFIVDKHREDALFMAAASGDPSVRLYRRANVAQHTPRTPFDFNDPYVSLAVGYRYIEYLQERDYIGDNLVYTLAAYNAGPGNLQKWQSRYGDMPADAFAGHIPYRETRHYVEKVRRDYKRYKELLLPVDDVRWVDQDSC